MVLVIVDDFDQLKNQEQWELFHYHRSSPFIRFFNPANFLSANPVSLINKQNSRKLKVENSCGKLLVKADDGVYRRWRKCGSRYSRGTENHPGSYEAPQRGKWRGAQSVLSQLQTQLRSPWSREGITPWRETWAECQATPGVPDPVIITGNLFCWHQGSGTRSVIWILSWSPTQCYGLQQL